MQYDAVQAEIDTLTSRRADLYRRKRQGEDTEDEITAITQALRPLRRELRLPVLWLALLLATYYQPGMNLIDLLGYLGPAMEYPLFLLWTPYSLRFLLGAAVAYAFGVLLYLSTRENRRPGEEHGSAKWGIPHALGEKYRDRKRPADNIIFTQNVQIGMDSRRHRRNLNVLVVGGSGAGKTRFYAKPNVMQANTSYLITDPKGELARAVAPLLISQGYDVQIFDLIDTAHSDLYNPFRYLRDDKDAIKLINNLIKNTTPKGAQQNDPFWEKSEIALDTALILYLMHEAPPEEQNFETVKPDSPTGSAKKSLCIQSESQSHGEAAFRYKPHIEAAPDRAAYKRLKSAL